MREKLRKAEDLVKDYHDEQLELMSKIITLEDTVKQKNEIISRCPGPITAPDGHIVCNGHQKASELAEQVKTNSDACPFCGKNAIRFSGQLNIAYCSNGHEWTPKPIVKALDIENRDLKHKVEFADERIMDLEDKLNKKEEIINRMRLKGKIESMLNLPGPGEYTCLCGCKIYVGDRPLNLDTTKPNVIVEFGGQRETMGGRINPGFEKIMGHNYVCSDCGANYDFTFNFCPDCGRCHNDILRAIAIKEADGQNESDGSTYGQRLGVLSKPGPILKILKG